MVDEIMENPIEEIDWDKIYKIKINGIEIDAKLNGNNYLVDGEVSDDIVANGDFITSLEIDGNVFENQKCVNKWIQNDVTHLIFDQITAQEMRDMEKEAKIEYLSMLLDADW